MLAESYQVGNSLNDENVRKKTQKNFLEFCEGEYISWGIIISFYASSLVLLKLLEECIDVFRIGSFVTDLPYQ